MIKAYKVFPRGDGFYSEVVFAETTGQARALAMRTDSCEDLSFIEIGVKRVRALDASYRGHSFMDWYNDQDRIDLVKLAGYRCDIDVGCEDPEHCPARNYCETYLEGDFSND